MVRCFISVKWSTGHASAPSVKGPYQRKISSLSLYGIMSSPGSLKLGSCDRYFGSRNAWWTKTSRDDPDKYDAE